jgi:hypothetical protein
MISVNTIYSFPSMRKMSILVDTVQLSTIVLITIVILTVLILWSTGRYLLFLRRYKDKLSDVPDSKLEWMIHGAKIAARGETKDIREKAAEEMVVKDRDYLRMASFGHSSSEVNDSVSPRNHANPPESI